MANLQAFEAVVYLDEAGIEFHVRLSYIWAERGKPDEREVWDNSSRERQNIIRAVDPKNDWHLAEFIPTGNAINLIEFFKDLLRKYRMRGFTKLYIVLDNAPFHHNKLVKKFVFSHSEHLELIFLPAYAPELMPEEKMWHHLRFDAMDNQYFSNKLVWWGTMQQYLTVLKQPGHGVQQWCGCYLDMNGTHNC